MTAKNTSMLLVVLALACVSPISSLSIGTQSQNNLQSFTIEVDGSVVNSKLVIDGNWHWLHSQQDAGKNCYPSDWNP